MCQSNSGRPSSPVEVIITQLGRLSYSTFSSLEAEVKLSAVDTVKDVIAAQMPFWDCLAAYKKKLPHDINAFFALADVEEVRIDEDPEEVVLGRSFRKMELVSEMDKNDF